MNWTAAAAGSDKRTEPCTAPNAAVNTGKASLNVPTVVCFRCQLSDLATGGILLRAIEQRRSNSGDTPIGPHWFILVGVRGRSRRGERPDVRLRRPPVWGKRRSATSLKQ